MILGRTVTYVLDCTDEMSIRAREMFPANRSDICEYLFFFSLKQFFLLQFGRVHIVCQTPASYTLQPGFY